MRKKELMRQNSSLFDKLQLLQKKNKELLESIKEKDAQITTLKAQLELQKDNTETVTATPIKKLENKIVSNVSVSRDVDFASEVIGRIVVKATEFSNRLTVGGETRYRELVNLILGKTEVAKSEILTIISSDASFDEKKEKIEKTEENTYEYFNSVMAQI